ncbi:hypothetical protein RHMOL_Rhmol04G0191800 [Rhododendron molle]|uniref:Uncharacterized protein n=1 Tax=Rhododendron molle TaxID=49168 RepID=A0ACC0P210_RHOML|nr:hypothetical protein RHMOL_Rhmol04G0191800 [Rhododendron molle]
MAEISSGNGGTGGDDGDRPRVGGNETGSPRIDDQPIVGASSSVSAKIQDSRFKVAPIPVGRTPVVQTTVGPWVGQLDYWTGVEALVVIGVGSAGANGSGSSDGGSDDRSRLLPRVSDSGKDPMVVDEPLRQAHIERVEFTPPVGSSSHVLVMSSDLTEFVGDALLARLMRENPAVVEAVLAAREERLREIAPHNEEERLRREEKARTPRTRFVAETYVPSEPHVFLPSGVESYLPLRGDYEAEQVLRDPDHHLSRTAQVPIEWAREAARLMLAMEKEFHKITSGTPL